MMKLIKRLKVAIYNVIRRYRCRVLCEMLDPEGKTLLDVGCQELYFYDRLKGRYEITLADYEPRHAEIRREDVQRLSFGDGEFDVVVCQQVLEHVDDPARAMGELRRVARRQLVISVPYEPFFTLARFCHWEKEHLWAVTPKALERHLGRPAEQRKLFFRRYYMASWRMEPET